MNKQLGIGILLLALCAVAATAEAAEELDPSAAGNASRDELVVSTPAKGGDSGLAIVGACFGAGFCAIGGGVAIAHISGKCIESIARQPEASGAMFAPMIVSAAMVEGGMLFAITVCLIGVLGL